MKLLKTYCILLFTVILLSCDQQATQQTRRYEDLFPDSTEIEDPDLVEEGVGDADFVSEPSDNAELTQDPETIGSPAAPLPRTELVKSIAESVLEFNLYSTGGSWSSHCCLYANRGNESYIALPKHCFDHDKTKSYKIEVVDNHGVATILKVLSFAQSSRYDAVMLLVNKFSTTTPALSNSQLIAKTVGKPGDSIIILTPFDSRNIYQKYGTLSGSEEFNAGNLSIEPGDSGGLILKKDGVIGMNFAHTDGGDETRSGGMFVPITVFESLYSDLVFKK